MATLPSPPRPNRESVTTIREDGSRRFLFPADVRGRFASARRWAALVLVGAYLAAPWVPIGDHPALFLDVANRRFHLFGATLAAQDLWLLFFVITGVGFTLYYLTSLLGRVWCGWACPQTVFLDHVFRRIERWIDGDAVQRRKLAAAPWDRAKVLRRVAKHGLFLLASGVITHLFLAYFVSIPQLWSMMHEAPMEHAGAFVGVMVATGILYFNFAWFREQLCIIICPYGRLQSALIDDDSLVIGYDAQRGEPRGKAGEVAGACVDCSRCVQVCPTGIDIRQGLQIECIACTACVDACDEVMDRLKRPRGLIRYDSLRGLQGKRTRFLRPRTIAYTVLLLLGAGAVTLALSQVRPVSLSVTRLAGAPFYRDADGIRNQYLIRVINKQDREERPRIRVQGLPPTAVVSGIDEAVVVPPLGETLRPVVIKMPLADYQGEFPLRIEIMDTEEDYSLTREVDFSGPDRRMLEMTGGSHGP